MAKLHTPNEVRIVQLKWSVCCCRWRANWWCYDSIVISVDRRLLACRAQDVLLAEETLSNCLDGRSACFRTSNFTGQHIHRKKQKCIHATNGTRTHDPNVPADEGRASFIQNGHCDRVRRQQVAAKHSFHLFDVYSGITDQMLNNRLDDRLTDWLTN